MAGSVWEGRLVRLRGVEPSDWEAFHEWDQDTETARASWRIWPPRSREGTRRFAANAALNGPEDDNYRYAVETLAGELVGTINTQRCDPHNGTFSYGVAIAAAQQRKGYASEAILLVLRYCFRELRYQKVTVNVYSFNEASIRLHERLGFTLEGRLRRMHYTNGQFYDELYFGMTAEECEQRLSERGL
jgi:RimJ/RimL family protein N-acetyltransferase